MVYSLVPHFDLESVFSPFEFFDGPHGRLLQFGEDNYMVGLSKFLSGWAPNISSLVAYFLSMLITWGDQTFALVPCSLTGLLVLLRFTLDRGEELVSGLDYRFGSFIAAPLLVLLDMLVFWATTTEIVKSRMRLARSLTNADWLVLISAAPTRGPNEICTARIRRKSFV